MLVLDQKEGSLEANYSLVEQQGSFFTRKTWSDTWLICSDNVSQTEDDVLGEFALLGTFSRNAFLKAIKPKQIATVRHPETGVLAFLWEVDVQYDSQFNSQGENPTQVDRDDPTNTRPKRRTYSEKDDDLLYCDQQTGAPVQTRNGEQIILTHPVYSNILEIQRYEPYPNNFSHLLDIRDTFVGKTNASPFYGRPTNTVQCVDINHEEEVITNTQGQKVLWISATYKFKTGTKFIPTLFPGQLEKVSRFVQCPLHEGYKIRKDSTKPPELNLDKKTKQPIRVNLDQFGVPVGENENPFYLQFNECALAEFGQLGLEF